MTSYVSTDGHSCMQEHLTAHPSQSDDAVQSSIKSFLEKSTNGVKLHNLVFSLQERLVLPYEPAALDQLRRQAPRDPQVKPNMPAHTLHAMHFARAHVIHQLSSRATVGRAGKRATVTCIVLKACRQAVREVHQACRERICVSKKRLAL
jgi:hypothetical protein